MCKLQIAVNDGCANADSVTFNQIVMLRGHDEKYMSDETFDKVLLLGKFFLDL